MLKCLPALSEFPQFALKGGTAINLFIFDLPRLSVDIDLVYLPEKGHEEGIKDISESLERLGEKIQKMVLGSKIQKTIPKNSKTVSKINVIHKDIEVTIEPNLVIRQALKKPKMLELVQSAQQIYETSVDVLVLDKNEIFAGKICAALDRQHPRDFFDVKKMLEAKLLSDELRKLFLAYLCGGNRPLHEVLYPTLLDQSALFDSHFQGMANQEADLKSLYKARDELISWIHKTLTDDEKDFLISFVEMNPDFSKLGIAGAEKFPSILWKQMNLQKLKTTNPKKFELQSTELKKKFQK